MTTKNLELLRKASDIKAWLDSQEIQDYTLVESKEYGFMVDTVGDVLIIPTSKNKPWVLPVKFNRVGGDFMARYCELTDLRGMPNIVDGSFDVSDNRLTSLLGMPHTIGSSFDCSTNKIESLEGIPSKIHGNLNISRNRITDLDFFPQSVGGDVKISENKIFTLLNCPKEIFGNFVALGNKLKSLEYCPEIVHGYFDISYNPGIKNLEFFPKQITEITVLSGTKISNQSELEYSNHSQLVPVHQRDKSIAEKKRLSKEIKGIKIKKAKANKI